MTSLHGIQLSLEETHVHTMRATYYCISHSLCVRPTQIAVVCWSSSRIKAG